MSQPPPPSVSNGFNSEADDPPAPYAFNANILAGAIIVLFLVIFFILMLHVYLKWFLRRSSPSYVIGRRTATAVENNPGLDKATIAQLPTFVYTATSTVDSLEAGKSDASVALPSLECSVCLSEFQENEKGRILPACKHVFHTECIDMWFLSHSTCPLCRTNVVPATATSAETASIDQQHQEQEAMELAPGMTGGDSATSHTVEYPCNILFWGNQTQVVSSQEPSTSSLPVSSSLTHGARALPQITIDIPSIEGNVVLGASGHLSAKCTTEQEAGASQLLKSPGLRASIKRMLSRQSSRHKSSSQEGNEESPK